MGKVTIKFFGKNKVISASINSIEIKLILFYSIINSKYFLLFFQNTLYNKGGAEITFPNLQYCKL